MVYQVYITPVPLDYDPNDQDLGYHKFEGDLLLAVCDEPCVFFIWQFKNDRWHNITGRFEDLTEG